MSTTLEREKKVNCLQEKLTELELQIAKGQKAFYQIGSALKIIRDEGLYSSSHSSFGNYCQQVWEMSKRKVNYLISAAGVIDNLKNYFSCDENNCSQIPLPANESQVRELAKLSSEEKIKIWEEIVGKVGNGEVVTAKLVKKTISEHYFGSGNDLLFDYSGNEENDFILDEKEESVLRGDAGCDSICCEQNKTLDKNENNCSLPFGVSLPFVVRYLILLDSTGPFPSIEKLVEQTISNHLNYYDLPGLGNFKGIYSENENNCSQQDKTLDKNENNCSLPFGVRLLRLSSILFCEPWSWSSFFLQSQVCEVAKLSSERQIRILKAIAYQVSNGEVLTEKLVEQTICINFFFWRPPYFDFGCYESNCSQIPLLTNESLVVKLANLSRKEQVKVLEDIASKVRKGAVLTEKLVEKTIKHSFDIRFIPLSAFGERAKNKIRLLEDIASKVRKGAVLTEKLVEKTISKHSFDIRFIPFYAFGERAKNKIRLFDIFEDDAKTCSQIALPTNEFQDWEFTGIRFCELAKGWVKADSTISWGDLILTFPVLIGGNADLDIIDFCNCMTIFEKNSDCFPSFARTCSLVKLAIPQSGFTWKNKNKTTSTVEKERSPPGVFIKSYRFTLA